MRIIGIEIENIYYISVVSYYLCIIKYQTGFKLLCPQSAPKYPSLHTQMKVSTLMSTQVPLFSQGELPHASKGPTRTALTTFVFWDRLFVQESTNVNHLSHITSYLFKIRTRDKIAIYYYRIARCMFEKNYVLFWQISP